MKVDEQNPYGSLDENTLDKFELGLGARLPEAYRQYLLNYNGGMWEPKCFVISKAEGESSVHSVYGLHSGPEYCQLNSMREIFSDRIPRDVLAIASDAFGNQICLGISGKRRDVVYFWNHEIVGEKGLSRIADSFENFIDSLFKNESHDFLEKILVDNDIETLKRLLDTHAIGLEDTNEFNKTLLERAAIEARPDVIKLLFERGAKLKNALAYAEKNAKYFEEHIPVVELIKQLAADQ
jgi:hypothetical protein